MPSYAKIGSWSARNRSISREEAYATLEIRQLMIERYYVNGLWSLNFLSPFKLVRAGGYFNNNITNCDELVASPSATDESSQSFCSSLFINSASSAGQSALLSEMFTRPFRQYRFHNSDAANFAGVTSS